MTAGISLDGVTRRYDLENRAVVALRGISHFIDRGSFTVVVGQSGCGKTTLLRVLAGLETQDDGRIRFYDENRLVGRKDFGLGMVFQEPRLMPWLTVEENIAFGIRDRLAAAAVDQRVKDLLALLGLEEFRRAYPRQISGGMAQRTALGRTLAFDPEVILMDEPFGALDYFTRRTLQLEMIRLHERTGKTFLLVTHDVEEALAMGQEILVLDRGIITEKLIIPFPRPRDTGETTFQPLRKRILGAISGKDVTSRQDGQPAPPGIPEPG